MTTEYFRLLDQFYRGEISIDELMQRLPQSTGAYITEKGRAGLRELENDSR